MYKKLISIAVVIIFTLGTIANASGISSKEEVCTNTLNPVLRTKADVFLEWDAHLNKFNIRTDGDFKKAFRQDAEFQYISALIRQFLVRIDELNARELKPTDDYLKEQFVLFKKAIEEQMATGIISFDRFRSPMLTSEGIELRYTEGTVWALLYSKNKKSSQILCFHTNEKSSTEVKRVKVFTDYNS